MSFFLFLLVLLCILASLYTTYFSLKYNDSFLLVTATKIALLTYDGFSVKCFRSAFLEGIPLADYEKKIYETENEKDMKKFGENRYMLWFEVEDRDSLHHFIHRILPSKLFNYQVSAETKHKAEGFNPHPDLDLGKMENVGTRLFGHLKEEKIEEMDKKQWIIVGPIQFLA